MTIDLPKEAWEDIVKALRESDSMTNQGLANMVKQCIDPFVPCSGCQDPLHCGSWDECELGMDEQSKVPEPICKKFTYEMGME